MSHPAPPERSVHCGGIFKPQVRLKGVCQMAKRRTFTSLQNRRWFVATLVAACILLPPIIAAQSLTGALIGTVKDEQGAVVPGALVRVASPALIVGPTTMATDERGQFRFPSLPPGPYVVDIELQGFAPIHEEDIRIGLGATLERTVILKAAGVAQSI